ncbi:methylenetetrahydrofolate reductase [NAD(P)H] [Garciella nitratireducens]|uniref:Methylenetetrahydrofolate reductase n=1 Tax=Garciella nitratireducens DSM 15102 TaxID=1121911 RepID=A0A1T4M883_9FIRM|nr:methylenetetrahydrofolate reductase [NAD(P)H] [Garciella nitratireducens]SJZ62998.1 5,10-methylenetetrahydrofolate reductase (NAD(P)) [Garciella nitratireducens DSM 15102]
MSIKKIFQQKKPVISFEIFPPKKDADVATVYKSIDQLVSLKPDFISVTYGAAGSKDNKTIEIASFIKNYYQIESLPHMTCITADKNRISENIYQLKKNHIDNVLALRGDIPKDFIAQKHNPYHHAIDLIREFRKKGDFSIGAAAYPEGHMECESEEKDLQYLREKVDAGVDFLITQLFFDNDSFYRFLDQMEKKQIDCKVSAGIMPILSKSQIEKMIFMCGASLPAKVVKLLTKYEYQPEELRKHAIEYAAWQVEDLLSHGADGVHIYTMNHPEVAKGILNRIR